MKMIPFTSMAAVLLLAGAGCTSVRSSVNDETKVVAQILARTAPSTLVFKDQAGAQQLVSSLETSKYFDFGVILDSEKQVFASYFRPDQISQKEKLLAKVTQSPTSDHSEAVIVDQGLAIAIVPMKINQQTVGYVVIGRKRS